MGWLSTLRGRGKSSTETRCPCGRYGKPGAHDGSCAWRDAKSRHPSAGGHLSAPPKGPSGPKPPSTTSGGVASSYSVYTTLTSPTPEAERKGADGQRYTTAPLPPARKGDDSGAHNPYTIHRRVTSQVDFVGEDTRLAVLSGETSHTTHMFMWKTHRDNALYQQYAAGSRYSPEEVLVGISEHPGLNVGTAKLLATNPYLPEPSLEKLTRYPDVSVRNEASKMLKKRRSEGDKVYLYDHRSSLTNMYRTLS